MVVPQDGLIEYGCRPSEKGSMEPKGPMGISCDVGDIRRSSSENYFRLMNLGVLKGISLQLMYLS